MMFTVKVERAGVAMFRHFPTREDMGEAIRRELFKGNAVLAVFFPGERWA